MKNFKLLIAVLTALAAFALTGCGTTIEPGYTGVKINKLGSSRGVTASDVVTGFEFYMPGVTKIVKYPTFNQRVAWTHDKKEGNPVNEELTFNTKDQIKVDMDASLNYSLSPAKVPDFYTQFRADNIDLFTHGFLRDITRNAVTKIGGEYNFDELNGVKKEEFLAKVEAEINKTVLPFGVAVKQFSSIGNLRPPAEINQAVITKTKSIQDAITAENQLRQIKAEAEKEVAKAEGEARANRAKAASITPVLLEQQRLDIERIRAQKWNGVMPTTVLGSNSSTLLNLNK